MDVLGLPLHPLVVHAAVVLIPRASLGALAVVVSSRARERFGWLTVAFAVAAEGQRSPRGSRARYWPRASEGSHR